MKKKTQCPICCYELDFCQCMYSGNAHPDRSKTASVVLQHLYLLTSKQLKHIIKLQKRQQGSYSDDRQKILEELKGGI